MIGHNNAAILVCKIFISISLSNYLTVCIFIFRYHIALSPIFVMMTTNNNWDDERQVFKFFISISRALSN